MTNGGQPMRLATNRFAMLIAAPVTVLMLAIVWLDRGNSGWAGELYNRVYLMSTWALLFPTLTLCSRFKFHHYWRTLVECVYQISISRRTTGFT